MTPDLVLPTNAEGDVVVWKAIAGGKRSHEMSQPIFPLHRPNYNLDRGVLIRIKAVRKMTGEIPIEEEFAKRR